MDPKDKQLIADSKVDIINSLSANCSQEYQKSDRNRQEKEQFLEREKRLKFDSKIYSDLELQSDASNYKHN